MWSRLAPAGWASWPNGRRPSYVGAVSSSWSANWVRYSSAYSPLYASRLACVPRSTMRPSSTTSSSSASRTVESRWAMTSDVRPARVSRRARSDRRLGLGVEVGRGLVEHHDVGRLEDEAGQGDPLLLAPRESVAPLADHRVQPVGQPCGQVADLRQLQGSQELLLRGLRARVGEVGPEGVVEEIRVLGHHTHDIAHRRHGGVAHVGAAQAYRTLGHVVQAGHQRRDGRLAGTRWAHQRHHLARLHPEGDVVQHLVASVFLEHGHRLERGQGDLFGARIGEVDVVELDGGVAPRDIDRLGVLLNHGNDVEHLEEPLEGHETRHDVDVDVGELGQRGVEPGQVLGQGDHGAHLEGAVDRRHATHPVDDGGGQRSGEGEADQKEAGVGGLGDADVTHPSRLVLE